MLRIDPEDGEEDGEVKQVKIKIDQNLFTYPSAKPQHQGRGMGGSSEIPSTSVNNVSGRATNSTSGNHQHRHHHHHLEQGNPSSYTVVSQQQSQPSGTPVAKV